MLLSTFNTSAGLIPVKRVQSKAGTKLFTLVLPSGRVFSCQPDGRIEDRDPNMDGGYETCVVQGNVATFCPTGERYFSFGIVLVEGL